MVVWGSEKQWHISIFTVLFALACEYSRLSCLLVAGAFSSSLATGGFICRAVAPRVLLIWMKGYFILKITVDSLLTDTSVIRTPL